MTTTRIPELLRAAWLAVLLAIAGCGPGTGGTGTGPIALSYSGGGSSGSDFAAAPPASACTVPAGCDRVDLLLEDTRVQITTGCARFFRDGPWEVDDNGLLELSGTVETVTTSGTSAVPATARLQFASRDLPNTTATVTVLGTDGKTLLGPVALQRSAAAAPANQPCR